MRKQLFCAFCTPSSRFQPIITTALFEKYSTSSNFYYLRQVDDILNNSCNGQVVKYHEVLFNVNHYEFLRRQYDVEEFQPKIRQLGEYYKFNRDFPRCFDKEIESALMRYQERLKKLDFRRVKCAIKKQQGVSITSQHSSSSQGESNQPTQVFSGNVLSQLNLQNSSDSLLLNGICAEIGKAYGRAKMNHVFRGVFQQNSRNFEAYLEKERKKSVFFKKSHQKNQNTQLKEEMASTKNGGQFFRLKPFTLEQKSSEKNSLHHHQNPLKTDKDKSKKERNDKVAPFNQINLHKFTNTLQMFYKINHNDKYQSIKSKNSINLNKKMKPKLFRKSYKNVKTPSLTRISRQQRNTVETERIPRDDSKKVFRKNSTLKPSVDRHNAVNQNRNAFIGNQANSSKSRQKTKNDRQSKSLSRSKSRAQLSKQSLGCQSSKRITRTPSNLTQNSLQKVKIQQKPKQTNKMNNLINKKLSLFQKF